ncbi:hypothetical protein LCGC14_0414350 [marine sediment metagenome]|uniref:Uncharacterized protein n=1 Tax=marine sediment metagenome TaxID=412755 RepID=A0A0F9SSQ6_9ZZZZ
MSRKSSCEVTCDGCSKTSQEKDEHDIPEGWTHIAIQQPKLTTGLGRRPSDYKTKEIDLCKQCATQEHLKLVIEVITKAKGWLRSKPIAELA